MHGKQKLLAGACVLLVSAGANTAAAETSASDEAIVVQGTRPSSSGATGLDLTLRETPQSVTIIPQQQIQDFGLNDASRLLDQVVGVNVERVETDRTYYNSRGFDITNFQVDGVGLPLTWGIQFGDLDTALFEQVEVIRGSTSMLTGTGNPSAAVNYVRKRPTDEFHFAGSAQYGSWDDARIEIDVSGPLTSDGSLTGRLVYANQNRDSYLDYYHVNRNVYYGVLSWEASPNLTMTAGYSMQDNRARGVLWGALPLQYSDGTLIDYDVSASTSADWTYWNIRNHSLFGEAVYNLGNDWSVKLYGEYKRMIEDARLLYAYGNPDPATGLGVEGMSGLYPSIYNQYLVDLSATGPFSLFGREHDLVVGINTSYSHGREHEAFDYLAPPLVYPTVQNWGDEQVAEPTYPPAYLAADQTDRMTRFYAATHLNITDAFKVVVGFSALRLTSHGYSYGTETPRDESAWSPYIGATYDLSSNVSLYASYTDIFNPQSEVDASGATLAAAQGQSYEAGVKTEWFDGRLYATAAIFTGGQSGLASYVDTIAGRDIYEGIDTFVEGYELEISGHITPNWTISGGWTDLSITDDDGNDVRLYTPTRTLKLSTSYEIPAFNDLRFGASLRWQDDVHTFDVEEVTQESYAVIDLMAGVNLTERVRANLNVNNVTDEKYLTSVMWNQAYYAAPRSVYFSLGYSF